MKKFNKELDLNRRTLTAIERKELRNSIERSGRRPMLMQKKRRMSIYK